MATPEENKPQELTRYVFDEWGTRYWALPDFLDELNAAVAQIPEAKRGETMVSLEGDYDETGKLRISYDDVETADEVAERIASREQYQRERDARDLAEFERLSAKFGASA